LLDITKAVFKMKISTTTKNDKPFSPINNLVDNFSEHLNVSKWKFERVVLIIWRDFEMLVNIINL